MGRTTNAININTYKYEVDDKIKKTITMYKSTLEISREFNCSLASVYRLMKRTPTRGKFSNIIIKKINIPVVKTVAIEHKQSY